MTAVYWAEEMSRRKVRHGEGEESGPAYRRCVYPRKKHKASFSFRSFVLRVAILPGLCLALACCGAEISRAEVSDAEKASYVDALTYCRGDVARPVALRSDKRVLCLDGGIVAVNEILLAGSLQQGGLFVVRSRDEDGSVPVIFALADILLLKQATVVINDYCLAICANYLFIATAKTFVPKDVLVAWINPGTGPDNCIEFSRMPDDPAAPRLRLAPCARPFLDSRQNEALQLKKKFYEGRVLSPPFLEPPQSVAVRRVLKRKFDLTGKYPGDVYWTWNPRHYAGAIRTKVLYEAYPQSQDEVDALVARIGLRSSVIYDP